mmetsp:Transcript_43112/g.69107  ORF Transcript_43112/g.69107 Transcript_43112/m.69107 type:complete len:230 (-) Transcript_43112:239-928(-)
MSVTVQNPTVNLHHAAEKNPGVVRQRSMTTDAGVNESNNLISGTINNAMETTGSMATNKKLLSNLQNSLKFIQERKWMATCRGIPEFLSPTEFSRPTAGVLWKRLSANTTYFFTNYIAFSILIFSFTILTDPWLFFGMLIIGYLWFWATKQPQIAIGKFHLEGNKKFGALCILTVAVMLLLGFHETVLITLAISSALIFIHAVFHKVPDAMSEVEDDDLIFLGSNVDNV